MSDNQPKYPIYVPSKGRYKSGHTIKFLVRDGVKFYIVVEPQEADEYGRRYGYDRLLVLPWGGDCEERRQFARDRGIEEGNLITVRNWIKEHSIQNGDYRHWQLDDNIRHIKRRYRGKRIPCNSGLALKAVEGFVDRYDNIAIAGLNYEMFLPNGDNNIPPFYLNQRVYSCSLILNGLPHKWRLAYNDDTDLCLQVLSDGFCTVLVNAFLIQKIATMMVKGGNTTDLYQGDGCLKMARSLERAWPGVVTTKRRFRRPQHVVKDSWKRFGTPLKLKPGINLDDFDKVDEFGMTLKQIKPEIKSDTLKELLEDYQKKNV